MQGEYVIALAGKANRSMGRIVAHPLLYCSKVLLLVGNAARRRFYL